MIKKAQTRNCQSFIGIIADKNVAVAIELAANVPGSFKIAKNQPDKKPIRFPLYWVM